MTEIVRPAVPPATLAHQRRLNRVLARVPRMGVIGAPRRAFVRAALALSALGSTRRVRRRGLVVEERQARLRDQDLRLRIIRPQGAASAIVIDIHGGAWAFGSARMDDPLNAAYAKELNAIVVSVDYRLALPRPVAHLQAECAAAVEWILSAASGLPQDVSVVATGESAGGHLIVSSLIAARDRGVSLDRVKGVLLYYGAYDLGGSASALAADARTLLLHGPTLPQQIELLLPGLDEAARRDPALSPAFADLHGLPPALLIAGEIDPLRDDSVTLATAMRAAGVDAELRILPDAPHGIIHMQGPYPDLFRRMGRDWLRTRVTV